MVHVPEITIKIIGILIGVAILALAIPQSVSHIKYSLLKPRLEMAQKQGEKSTDKLLEIYNSQLKAGELWSSASFYSSIFFTEIDIAKSVSDKSLSQEWLVKAHESAVQSILKNPSDPYSWSRFSYIRNVIFGANAKSTRAVVMSVLTGPFEKSLIFNQINYALIDWQYLSPDEQILINEAIVKADNLDRKRLVHFAKSNPQWMKIIVQALSVDRKRLGGFVRALF